MLLHPFLIGTGWQEIKDGDLSLMTMFRRHYSYEPGARAKKPLAIGPGFKLVLMTADAGAVCAWRKELHRKDGQEGVNCSIFRRESGDVASELLKSAMERAWDRWPDERLFTFVDPRKVSPTMMRGRPTWGHCFYQAGWKFEGLTKTGLHILAAYPAASLRARAQ